MKKQPRDYQIDDLAFIIKQERGAFLHDPGGGKTLPACLWMYYLWTHLKAKSYFVMPKSLLRKNKVELLETTDFKDEEIIILDGTPKQRQALMASPHGKVFLMGFKRFSDDWKNLRNLHPELNAVIIDEVHMGFKSHDSVRTKELFKCMRLCKYFLAMSGTLIDGRLDSCYPTVHIIEPRYYTNYYSFKAQHALTDEYGTVVEWINHHKLGYIFKKHCVRRSFESIYGKQEVIIHPELAVMSDKQRKAYSEFEETALLELDDKFLEGFNPAVAAMRCRQIMAHPETFKLIEPYELTGKDENLLVHLEDHRNRGFEPILVYAALQPEQERIARLCEKEGFSVGLINGNVSAEKRSQIDLDFQSGKINCVVASPATAAVGFNWSHVNHVVFTSLDYQNVNFVQAYRRAIRGKRTKPLWVSVLEYENSIDQRIFEIINKKSSDLNKVDDTYGKLNLGLKNQV